MARTLRAAVALGVGLYLGGSLVAVGQTLPTAKPEEVGLSSSRLARLTEVLKDNIAKGEIPGAVLLVARNGKIAYFESLGQLDPQAKTPMRKDAIFRIYSMSKPITTVAAMMLLRMLRSLSTTRSANTCRHWRKCRSRSTTLRIPRTTRAS